MGLNLNVNKESRSKKGKVDWDDTQNMSMGGESVEFFKFLLELNDKQMEKINKRLKQLMVGMKEAVDSIDK